MCQIFLDEMGFCPECRSNTRGEYCDQHKVFMMLLSKAKITEDLVSMLMKWPPARRAAFGIQRVLWAENLARKRITSLSLSLH